jgi:hypothetical protein
MNSILLYQWNEMIDKAFAGMGRWQKQMLARFSYGVLLAHSCTLNVVAKRLIGKADAGNLERGMQRWLANERLVMPQLIGWWIGWVLHLWGKPRC